MYLPVPSERSCVRTWLTAVRMVHSLPGHEANDVILVSVAPEFRSDLTVSA